MLGELALIERIRAGVRARNAAVRVGIGDDCAVLRVPSGHEMVVTTDLCLEGRHFRRDWHSPESAGHRCLTRGLSDLAAMGGRPLAAFLSLALPKGYELAWVDGFMAGFGALAERFGVELAGGDLGEAAGAEIVADVMVVGAVEAGKALLRSGARVGDGVYVTGTLGGSAAELLDMQEQAKAGTQRAQRGAQSFPEPRVGIGLRLIGLATACMDLSDGLSLDLRRLCEASGVGASILRNLLPVAAGATLEQALHGGEDYELLFTATASSEVPAEIDGVRVSRVGEIVAGSGVKMDGKELAAAGWEHLRGERIPAGEGFS